MATFVYLRVSTDRQDVENQCHGILEYANSHRLGAIAFVEDAVSGRVGWRELAVGQLLLETASSNDVVLFAEVSRMGRSIFQVLEIAGDLYGTRPDYPHRQAAHGPQWLDAESHHRHGAGAGRRDRAGADFATHHQGPGQAQGRGQAAGPAQGQKGNQSQAHATEHADRIIDLLEVWAAEAGHPDRQREARTML